MAPEEKGAQAGHPDISTSTTLRNEDREQVVVRLWKKNRISAGAIVRYLNWVRPFLDYCQRGRLEETSQLTLEGLRRFLHVYVCPRTKGPMAPASCHVARTALHAWAWALGALRVPVPEWRAPRASAELTSLLAAYCHYRRSHCGIAESTLRRDIWTARVFLALLPGGRKSVSKTSVPDIDRFVSHLAARVSKQTVARRCVSLRALPPVAKALAAYLQEERPSLVQSRRIFLNTTIPYTPLSSGVFRDRIRHHARQAGIDAPVLGAHVFRHSHATRQIDAGANPKVVSDILGHRCPSSTSVYVRVALRRLREVALPVPR